MSLKELFNNATLSLENVTPLVAKPPRFGTPALVVYAHAGRNNWTVSGSYSPEDLAGGSQQMAFAQQELSAKDIENAMKVYLMDGAQLGDSDVTAHAESATKDPLNSVVVLAPGTDEETEARDKLRTHLTDSGVLVVDHMEDAVDYANSRLL